jgi:hypothetical protein
MESDELTVAEIKKRQDDDAWTNELKRLGRHDLIKTVGTAKEPPQHYNVGIEPVKFITSHGLGFLEGNIIKYIVRYKLKGNPVEDLHKARVYIDLLLKQYEV